MANLYMAEVPKVAGSLPSEWATLTELQQFVMYQGASLTGSLPPQWGTMTSLTNLFVGINTGLTGTLPSQWDRFTQLTSLALFNNHGLAGSLPSQWASMRLLTYLYVVLVCVLCVSLLTTPCSPSTQKLLWHACDRNIPSMEQLD
jgi:hypothetical protein